MNTPALFCLDNVGIELESSIEDLAKNIDLNIYPNPSSDFINVEGIEDAKVSASIYSISGALLQSNVSLDQQIDIRSLENGSYILAIKGDGWKRGISFSKL